MNAHSEKILILAATARDGQLAEQSLSRVGYHAITGSNPQELESQLREGIGALILAQEAYIPEVALLLDSFFESQPPWSDLPIVFLLASDAKVESPSVARLRSYGNLAILERPLRQTHFVAAIETALRARRRQYQVRDLLEEKEADVRRRDEFLAMLGHELRNPLAAIRYASTLLDELDGHPSTRKPREVIGRQTSHLSHLVDDLLDVARVTRGKIALNKSTLDLNEIAAKSLEGIRAARHDANHEITFQPSLFPLPVEADAVRLEQVFSNLLFNAVKYTPPGGSISLSVSQEMDRAVARVQDNGIGIESDLLARVFDLFSQSESTLARSRGGLGIGLTLVRGLVELHGGQVHAHSEGIGQGSTFEVRLPLQVKAETVAQKPSPKSHTAEHKILLVEDNDDSREVLKLLLELSGHHVECAVDGQEAVEKLVRARPDVALVDIGLPVLDGYEVATRVRAALGDEIVLIALTGYGQPEDRKRALDAGFNEHLTKPVEPLKLREVLGRVLSHASADPIIV